jgi:hypothetical protein
MRAVVGLNTAVGDVNYVYEQGRVVLLRKKVEVRPTVKVCG